MISVAEAEALIYAESRDYGHEWVLLEQAQGRFLAQDIVADRDMPPFDRVTMDGIAIQYACFAAGNSTFEITGSQYAGQTPLSIGHATACVEIMTGAALPDSADTVIRYEDLSIAQGKATITIENVKKGQNIHRQGEDHKAGEILIAQNTKIEAQHMAVLASVGAAKVAVKKHPRVLIISSGDELVPVESQPAPQQIRRSNGYAIAALLKKHGLQAAQIHIADEPHSSEKAITEALEQHDILILSGGVSMGKKDYIPGALERAGVTKIFHKIAQKPGKPFYFGKKDTKLIFALPGNPVSSFMCVCRYIIPWWLYSMRQSMPTERAFLKEAIQVNANLSFFVQVKLFNDAGRLWAHSIEGHGSGDFGNLLAVNAFAELAPQQASYQADSLVTVWRF